MMKRRTVHPGRLLRRQLAARYMSASKLALALRAPTGRAQLG